MGRGLLPISANFERRIAAPIDDMRVQLKSDLLLPASWTADDNVVYTWLGMFALVYGDPVNNGGYLLIASDYTLEASWIQIGSSVDLSDYVTAASLFRNGLIKSELLPDITSDVIELLELASILEDVVGMVAGDKAFYTDDNKIYTYSGTAWENPQSPVVNKLYLCKFDNLTYKWNGTTLVATTSPLPYANNDQAIAGTSFSRVLSPYANKYAFTTWIAPYALKSWVTDNYVAKNGTNRLLTLDEVTLWNKDTIPLVCSDEISDLTASTTVSKLHYVFRDAYTRTLSSILADLNTASTGTSLTIDIKKNGISIFSTLLTIDAIETSNVTAVTPYVLTGTITFSDTEYIDIYVTTVGSISAGRGLKINLLTTKS